MSNINYDALTNSEWEKIRSQRAVRLSIARNSFYWFFHLYMGHYIKYPTAEFQKQMMADVTNPDIEQLVIVAFRESGKSTIITTALPLWAAIGEMQKKYIVIVSQTQNQAQQHLANIVQELETNDLIRKDFWPYDYEENETGVSAIKLPRLGVRIIAVSREQGVRGLRHGPHRPDLIIADDVEDSRTVKTREGRDRNFAWFTGELLPLGSDNTKFITVGNLLHEDSLLMRLRAGMESGERNGAYREYPIERDGVSLWPERFPDKDSLVMLERRIADRVRFEREYRLHLVPDDDQIIFPDMIHQYDKLPVLLRGQSRTLVVGVDLAISEKDSADYTAMVMLDIRGHGDNMRIYVLPNPVNKRMNFPATIDLVRELNVSFHYPKFFVETTAYQEALVQALSKDVIDATGVHPNQDKRTRLNMIADKIQRGVILFPKHGSKELLSQLVGFGIEKHDDLVDALTVAVIEAVRTDLNTPSIVIGTHNLWSDTRSRTARNTRRGGRDYWNNRLDDWITAIGYDKYAKKYNDEKTELERKLVEYTNNDKSFVVTSSYLLQLASKAKDVFESSQPNKKNKILKMLLANCQINQKRLQLHLLKPFDRLLSAMKSQNWLTTIEEVITMIKLDCVKLPLSRTQRSVSLVA